MTRIKLTNGFPHKPGTPIRLGIILLEGDVEAQDSLLTPEGDSATILEVKTVPEMMGQRRAVLVLGEDCPIDWHPYYGQELSVRSISHA